MRGWRSLATEAALSGSLAALFSAAALALAGWRQGPSGYAPLNAPSQWLWGTDEALAADGPSRRHTLAGYLVHHLASLFWSGLHALAFAGDRRLDRAGPALVAASATTAVAALVDLELTPERLTPGFQHRITPGALAAVYACFALGLAAGSLLARRQRYQDAPRPRWLAR